MGTDHEYSLDFVRTNQLNKVYNLHECAFCITSHGCLQTDEQWVEPKVDKLT